MTGSFATGPAAVVTIGVVGTGNMGAAMVRGWLRDAAVPAAEPAAGAGGEGCPGAAPYGMAGESVRMELIVWDKIEAAARRLLTDDCVSLADSLDELVARADVVVVVVKPKDAEEALRAIAPLAREGQVIVSSMGGRTLRWMREVLGPVPVIVRIMPNLAVELGAGAVTFASEPGAATSTVSAALALLRPLGVVEVVPEDLFDAVTAVSGSGPAFLALAVESLEDGAVAAGLSRSAARAAVRRSMLDAACLLTQHADSPEALREQAVRAGRVGPTALALLEDRGVRSAYRRAVEAAVQRSRQMQKA